MKKIFIFIALFVAVFQLCSCSVEERANVVSPQADKFSNFLMNNLKTIATADLTVKQSPVRFRSKLNGTFVQDSDKVDIYINYPEGTSNKVKELTQYVTTAADISALYRHTAANFYDRPIDGSSYKVSMSKSKARETLQSLLPEAKSYLRSQGMTDEDIDKMVQEYHGDQLDLILTAMYLMDQEYESQEQLALKNKSVISGFPSLFVTKAYASDFIPSDGKYIGNDQKIGGEDPRIIPNAFFQTALDCSIHTLVGKFIGYAFVRSAGIWALPAITTAFKTIASKMLGPVGVAIAVVAFSYCMYSRRNIYTCTYTMIMPSEYEKQYTKLLTDAVIVK